MGAEAELVHIAKALAGRVDYVQGAGGNISVKSDNRMWIKASGKRFADLAPGTGYVQLEHERIAEYFRTIRLPRETGESDSLNAIRRSVLDDTGGRPSMETGFHAVLGPVVIHTHSVYANVLNCRKNAEVVFEELKNALPAQSHFLKYYSPGYDLSVAIASLDTKETPLLFLKNHGIIVHADTADEALELLQKTDDVLKTFFHLKDWKYASETAEKDLNKNYIFPDQVVYFPAGEGINNLSESQCELAGAYAFVADGVRDSGGVLNFMEEAEVQYIGGMEMEKHRKKQFAENSKKLRVVIPMSGLGSRFAEAGYREIKPLIPVMGKPIVEWVCDMFPGADAFLFICREEHLETTNLREELQRIRPEGQIVSIPGHKLGPVYAVHCAADLINDDEEVVVNYCDFFMDWDFGDFRETMQQNSSAGGIPCYTGFHPHLLHAENVYAVCKTDHQMHLTDIREKHRFDPDPEKNYHSAGTYYFRSGKLMKQVFAEMLDRPDLVLNGEYYVSLAYRPMLENNMDILVYDGIRHFCQWGTPRDLQEFQNWEQHFKSIYSGSVFKKNI